MKIHRLAIVPLLFLASCGSDSAPQSSVPAAAPTRKKLSERLDENNGYKQDANGNWLPQNDRRSEYESKGKSQFANKDFKKQEYKAGDYAKKSWWGNKEYDRQAYAGETDGSRFQKSSALQGQGAREAANTTQISKGYDTGNYATGSAREANAAAIGKSTNDGIENRRKAFQQPEIIDWREQRSVTMVQSRGILGR